MATTVIFVRHGETEWNRVERFRGRYDIPLNSTGLKQANRTAKWISTQWKPAAIYSSPLSRATQTAEAIARVCSLSVQPNIGLIDFDFGKWQGLTPEEARAEWPEKVTHWYEHPETADIPGGENLSQVRTRAMSAMKDICWLHANKQVVVVSHTHVICLILMAMLGIENDRFWGLRQDNCAISLAETTTNNYIVRSMNCTSHLLRGP